jgi:hypothetical protein
MNTKQTPGHCLTLIMPASVETLMTGVRQAEILPSNYVRLFYTDGTTEGAHLTAPQVAQGRGNLFALVSAVQSMRPNTLTFSPN